MSCRELRERLAAYADDELGVEGALELEGHLRRCPSCAADVERQRRFRRTVGVLYPRQHMPEGARRRLLRELRPRSSWWRAAGLPLALAASVVVAVGLRAWRAGDDTLPAAVRTAVALHETAERGTAPLALTSSDLPAVNRWLHDELPFAGAIGVGPAALRLVGASSVQLGADQAAWVVYRDGEAPVSLFVLPPRAWPAVGRAVEHRGMEFRTLEVAGHRVIAWNHDPVSYLLVSGRDRRPAEACAVCHVGPEAAAIAGFAVPAGS